MCRPIWRYTARESHLINIVCNKILAVFYYQEEDVRADKGASDNTTVEVQHNVADASMDRETHSNTSTCRRKGNAEAIKTKNMSTHHEVRI